MSLVFLTEVFPLPYWSFLVGSTVSESYLDEVFHVGQTQAYCRGRFDVWDPKITTPPGLYLLSYALSPIFGCNLVSLRALSLLCGIGVGFLVRRIYTPRMSGVSNTVLAQCTAVNITLFPPLFFFTALYYTDVASTLSVLLFYYNFLLRFDRDVTWRSYFTLVCFGLVSLLFRQTNIFWVAVFPAGLAAVKCLDKGHHVVKESMHKRTEGFGESITSIARTSWKMDVVYMPLVGDAWLEDYISTALSVVICVVKLGTQPKRIGSLLIVISPYLTLIAVFAGFVLYNGGVVLGDKSNHIASLHLPQMLYIWPNFVFFSWPIVYPYLSALPLTMTPIHPALARVRSMFSFNQSASLPRIWTATVFVLVACFIIRFNTIVHPFLLADNRHYTFYVFRLLMRPWWMRYAVAPIYVLAGWACIQAFSAIPTNRKAEDPDKSGPPRYSASEAPTAWPKDSIIPNGTNSANTAFILIWLATTALQLITAPLVEPRYLILPWIFWRMHTPLRQHSCATTHMPDPSIERAHVDERLHLETAWFLLINAVTGYIFLYRGFDWSQEPGLVQRFMW